MRRCNRVYICICGQCNEISRPNCLTNRDCVTHCSENDFPRATQCRLANVASNVASRSARNRSHNHRGVLFRNSNRRVSNPSSGHRATLIIRARRTIRFSPLQRVWFPPRFTMSFIPRRDPANEFQHTNAICGNYIFFLYFFFHR